MLRSAATTSRRVAVACAVVLAMAMVAAVGLYLADAQADARSRILGDFDSRAGLAAEVTGDTVSTADARTREWAEATFAGPPAGLSRALGEADDDLAWLAVLGADGTVLGTSAASIAGRTGPVRANPGFRLAVSGGRLAYGDVVVEDGVPMVYGYQPFRGAGGTRVLVVPTPVAEVAGILRSAVDVTGSRSYVVDSTGAVVLASDDSPAGRPVPDATLAAAVRQTGPATTGDVYHLTVPVAGSTWRVFVTTARSALLEPVRVANRAAWLIFAGFATTITLFLLLGAAALISSARLAHARLHDTLTGLPSRALFLERARHALAQQRPVAALFLDLDGFKPVNDTYGHAAGDALLAQVAQRLVAATRPDDLVSRFGGDEFLVLCRGLREDDDAYAVAERIRHDLTQPFDLNGRAVRVGVSIGIAVPDAYTDTAEALVHNADVALYRAKDNGRGRIERFTPEPASAHRD